MDSFDHLNVEERAALDAMRAGMRARAERMVACVNALKDPETLNYAWRSLRLIRQADAMVCQLYAAPDRVMRPVSARRAVSITPALTPQEPENQQVAATSAEAASEPVPVVMPGEIEALVCDPMAETFRRNTTDFMANVDAHAHAAGFWPNGQTVTKDEPYLADFYDLRLICTAEIMESSEAALTGPLAFKVIQIRNFNASTQHRARHDGAWPDGSMFDPEVVDYGYWCTCNGDLQRAPGEDIGSSDLPLWEVRRKPPPPPD